MAIPGAGTNTGPISATDSREILPYHTELLMCDQERVIKMNLQVMATLVLKSDIPGKANWWVVGVALNQGFRVLMPIKPAAPMNLVTHHLVTLRARGSGERTETPGSV